MLTLPRHCAGLADRAWPAAETPVIGLNVDHLSVVFTFQQIVVTEARGAFRDGMIFITYLFH